MMVRTQARVHLTAPNTSAGSRLANAETVGQDVETNATTALDTLRGQPGNHDEFG